MKEIDEHAKAKAKILGMPEDVHIPIGARDQLAVLKFIGAIEPIDGIDITKAFVVIPYNCPIPNPRLPLWEIKESMILHSTRQLWVHVDYRKYRLAYKKAYPQEEIKGLCIDHIFNRRVARLKRFTYLRVIPVSPGVNTSSGGVTEKYGFDYHSTPRMIKLNAENQASIEYADKADIIKMLNMKTGGKFQDVLRDTIYLFIEK